MRPDYLGIFILIACATCWVQGFALGVGVRLAVDGFREEWRKLRELWKERKS